MPEKLLCRLADGNPDLQKQIGCMSGILQVFDRRRLLTGKRLNGHSNKSNSPLDRSSAGSDHSASSPPSFLEKNLSKSLSMESSKTSWSSSSYSSFSSSDCNNNSSRQDSPSVRRSLFALKSMKTPPKSKNYESDAKLTHFKPQTDPKDVVRDSIQNNVQASSVKTLIKERMRHYSTAQTGSPKLKNASSHGTRIEGKSRVPFDLNEFRRALNGTSPASRTSPGFSFDAKESRSFLDSEDSKTALSSSSANLRDRPRLSLDSRIGSLRRSNFDHKRSSILENLDQSTSNRRASVDSDRPQGIAHHKRASSVIVKLMGLEMPNSNKEKVDLADHVCGEKKNGMMFGYMEGLKQQPGHVYREIEKRLEELEFQKSNHGLRALKQVMETMHSKGRPSTAPVCNTSPANSHNSQTFDPKSRRAFDSPIVIMKPARSIIRSDLLQHSVVPLEQELAAFRRLRMSDHPVNKKNTPVGTKMVKDRSPQHNFRELFAQSLPSDIKCRNEQHGLPKIVGKPSQGPGSSVKTSNSLSPRLQKKKTETENGLHLRSPTSQMKKLQRQPPGRSSESVSPRSMLRPKPPHAQQNDEQPSEISSESRKMSQQGDEISSRSDSNISLPSQVDYWSSELNPPFSQKDASSPSARSSDSVSSSFKNMNYSCRSNEEASDSSLAAVSAEQPSPISVLDARISQDDDSYLSPVKRYSSELSGIPSHKMKSRFSHKKLENVERLVQELSLLSSNDQEAPDSHHLSSICEMECPDHSYVLRILLRSGILTKDLNCESMLPIQIHPIKPQLFYALEEHKSVERRSHQLKFDPETLHRKLVFDIVNELLTQKLKLSANPALQLQLSQTNAIVKLPSGQCLVKELCADIERLKAKSREDAGNSMSSNEDDLKQVETWMGFGEGLPATAIALSIERLIYRDLVEEMVDEVIQVSGLQSKASRRRRQLFPA
ncbi:protein LONGIFOLIA 1 [Canna indica]|uniref:Protein LONGIFOLIA 1 n=1 Tax=Canna indica TaxID=4628 RepID=A0AAQ3KAP5_9LILI|nr:protein LONGIFOLIA 1 [Canna indica]